MHVYPTYYKRIHSYIKKNFTHQIFKKILFAKCKNDNLSFDELRLIAQFRNISDYENKSKEDLIKGLSELETPKIKAKPKTKPKQRPKPEPEIRVNKKKLKNLKKDFDELRHRFSKKEIDR